MKENYIHQILRQFFLYTYPPETEGKVQRWIIEDKWTAEKNEALSAIWDEAEIPPHADTYKALKRVKHTIRQIESKKKQVRMRRILLGSAAVIIPILLLWGGYFYLHREVKMIEVVTSGNQQKQCTLSDGTTILLNSCTRITYPSEFKDSVRVVTLAGEACFSVASDAAKPFVVKTEDLSVRVLGTRFNLSAYPPDERTVVTLNSGRIQVDIPAEEADRRYILQPDEEIVFNKTDKSVSVSTVTGEDTGWQDGSLVFRDATFRDMVNAIERRYGVRVVYDKSAFPDTPYTLKFVNNESLEEVLEILQEVAGGFEYKKENSKVTLIRKGGDH